MRLLRRWRSRQPEEGSPAWVSVHDNALEAQSSRAKAAMLAEEGVPYIVCPQCEAVSCHPEDIRQRYCGQCHQYHEFMGEEAQ